MADASRPVGRIPGRDEALHAGDADSPVRPGDRVAHYQIVEEIGRGGMGIVFRARDSRLGREVALKCPWPLVASDAAIRERFVREARSASRVAHPHIVSVFEILNWGGLPWLATELVEGRSLRALLRQQGPFPLTQIVRSAEGLTDALRAAHAKGVIHRDVNPSNILVRNDGWPLLTDFGLAHVLAAADCSGSTLGRPLTGPGHVIGTQGYMSPEQVLGKPLDARTDIFSLGAVLYEMCTARRAFVASEAGSADDAILHRQPEPISQISPAIPVELERIVSKALAKRPEDRYQDARAFHADVAALRRLIESPAYWPSLFTHTRLTGRRAAWVAALAIAAAVMAAAPWLRARFQLPGPTFPGGIPRQVTSEPGCETEPVLSPDGGLIAYTSISSGNTDIWITDLKGGSRLRLTDDPATDRRPSWFPDGSALAFASDRGGEQAIWKVPSLGGSAVLLAAAATDPAVSPNGRYIAFSRPNAAGYSRIVVAPLERPSQVVWMTGEADGQWNHIEPAWSPNGRTICYADARNLWIADIDGGRPRRLTNENATDFEPAWSSDGRFVTFSSYREGTHALWRVPAQGGTAERLTVGTGPESHASISLDGSRLAYSTYLDNYDIVVVDLATANRELIRSLLWESAPTLAPDGSVVVFTSSRRGGHYDLWTQSLSEGKPAGPARQLTDLSGTVNTPAFSPDARWVAFKREVDGRREIWTIPASGGDPQRFSDGAGNDLHPAWSPDGAELAYVSERAGGSHIWAAPIREGRRAGPSRQLSSGDTTDHFPAWSWDGLQVAYVARREKYDEVRIAPARGGGDPRPVARGANLGRVRWEKPTGWLWFSAAAAGGEPRVWKVPREGGQPLPALRSELFAEASSAGDFDLSSSGRFLAFTREEIRGDVWLLESRKGAF